MRIVVLAGGLSMERNVSLSSGTRICRALRARGHQAALVDLFLGLEGSSSIFMRRRRMLTSTIFSSSI